ncbi:MAG: YcjX family protein [Geminicoccaceae bacterium]|jgi:predicted YcjX-like family ATPase|nr:YcjX family protein [Geminicoccaceae bacterium]HRY23379.1 YcjX family protein [Geminicoccaceae bacterium]
MLGLDRLGGFVRDLPGEVAELGDRLVDRHLRLAVTGLRRSGKTVFTTALVHHLLDGHDLAFVGAVHEGRYRGARLLPVRGPAFPYATFHRTLMADRPTWPDATDRLTVLKLELRFRTTGLVQRLMAPNGSLILEIIDYPGEWLLDLPLLEMDYPTFSETAAQRDRVEPRAAVAGEWRAALAGLSPTTTPAELVEVYRRYLGRVQNELGLSLVQPGRLVTAGADPATGFAPLPDAAPAELRRAMAARFETYKRQVVEPFYTDHFSRFDRQIVLVDLFHTLNRGRAHFADSRDALETILESFRYGTNSLLARLFRPSIEKLLFAASKADHVAANQHANLKQLLELMIAPARRKARFAGLETDVLALAALRATDTVRTEHQGQLLSCVRGRLADEGRETVLFPGEIPGDLPDDEDWRSGRFRFRDFEPRRLEPGVKGQHLRLDQAIEFLIGDKLR